MKTLAPEIFRQRLLVEGFYGNDVGKKEIEEYFTEITTQLDLRAYGKPIIFSPGGLGKEENQGFDAFIPLIDSGISLYVWCSARFISAVLYTCKGFNQEKAIEVTRKFFEMKEFVSKSF